MRIICNEEYGTILEKREKNELTVEEEKHERLLISSFEKEGINYKKYLKWLERQVIYWQGPASRIGRVAYWQCLKTLYKAQSIDEYKDEIQFEIDFLRTKLPKRTLFTNPRDTIEYFAITLYEEALGALSFPAFSSNSASDNANSNLR